MTTIGDDIKRLFREKNMLTRLIMINISVFVVLNVLKLLLFLFQGNVQLFKEVTQFLAVPAYLPELLYKPWTIITYMFLHLQFFHILFNMLWLYWMGMILSDLLTDKKIFPIYFYGGITGAVLYIIAYNLFPVFADQLPYAYAMGASAGVLAIVIAAATLAPDYTIQLLFFGAVRLKYLALVSILLDLISIPGGNAGGHIAHLGGALFGFIFIKQLQKGNDWSKGLNNFLDLLQKVPKAKVSFKSDNVKKTKNKSTSGVNQEKIDKILDKISASGYDSLSSEEKEILFKFGKK